MRYQGCWLISLDGLQHIHWVSEYWRRPRFWEKVFSLLLVKVWGACEAYLSGLGIGNWHHEQGWDYLWRVSIVLRGKPPQWWAGADLQCSVSQFALVFPLLHVMLVTWNRQCWKYLQYRNWQKLQILGLTLPLNWLSACYLNISKA